MWMPDTLVEFEPVGWALTVPTELAGTYMDTELDTELDTDDEGVGVGLAAMG
jgi:hypothetical protein